MGISGVHLFRCLPFWVFPAHRPTPDYIKYLGKVLPAAMFGMLVVFCYKNIDILHGYRGAPDFIAGAVTLGLHFWRKKYVSVDFSRDDFIYGFSSMCLCLTP